MKKTSFLDKKLAREKFRVQKKIIEAKNIILIHESIFGPVEFFKSIQYNQTILFANLLQIKKIMR